MLVVSSLSPVVTVLKKNTSGKFCDSSNPVECIFLHLKLAMARWVRHGEQWASAGACSVSAGRASVGGCV